MKSRIQYAVIFCLALGGSAFGQSVEELGVAKPSSFEVADGERDPLWPIGWVKKAQVENVVVNGVAVEVAPRAESFYVSSISLDRIPLAVINGKAYGVGDRFIWTMEVGKDEKKNFRLQIVAIRDGVVTLRYGTTDLNCPLRVIQAAPPAKSPAPK